MKRWSGALILSFLFGVMNSLSHAASDTVAGVEKSEIVVAYPQVFQLWAVNEITRAATKWERVFTTKLTKDTKGSENYYS